MFSVHDILIISMYDVLFDRSVCVCVKVLGNLENWSYLDLSFGDVAYVKLTFGMMSFFIEDVVQVFVLMLVAYI